MDHENHESKTQKFAKKLQRFFFFNFLSRSFHFKISKFKTKFIFEMD